jgi:hypothetical protein
MLDWLCCQRLYKRYDLTHEERTALQVLVEQTQEAKTEELLGKFLQKLWQACRSGTAVPEIPSESWKELGFQGSNPSTDIRAGFFVVRQLEYLVSKYATTAQRLTAEAMEQTHYYSFAIVSFNVSFMITRYFRVTPGVDPTGQGKEATREEMKEFAKRITADDEFINKLYVAAIFATHERWRAYPDGKTLLNFSDCLRDTLNSLLQFLLTPGTQWSIISPSYAQLLEIH